VKEIRTSINISVLTSILIVFSYLLTSCCKASQAGSKNAFINLKFLSCLENTKEKSYSSGTEIVLKDFIILYSFNGDCAACILEFIKFLKLCSEKKISDNCSSVFLIYSRNKDADLIMFFMEKYSMNLPQNSYMFLNKNNCFEEFNPAFEKSKGVNFLFLVRSTGEIITELDPYDYRQNFRIFKKAGILSP